eukprot:8497270-Prorocentrum_lima.AAC.1
MEPDDLDDDVLLNNSNAGLAKKLQKHEQSIAGIAKNVFILLESLGMSGEHRPTRSTPAPATPKFTHEEM